MPVIYPFPDGTTSVHRPSDGQVFTQYDTNQNPLQTWEWDDFSGTWIPRSIHYYLSAPTAIEFVELKMEIPHDPKCECGSDTCGHPGHSHYCPKFQPNL